MKINFILPGLGISGGIKVVEKYAEILNEQGNDVVIYCSIQNANLHRYKSNLLNLTHQVYCTMKTLVSFLRKERNEKPYKWVWSITEKSIRSADCTLATMWATAYEVDKLPSICGKKYYFIQDFEVWDNKELGLKSYLLPLNKIVISTWINTQLKDKLGIGPFPIVMNGMDLSKFHHIKNNQKSSKIVQFLMLNHSMPKKGINDGLKAFEQVHNMYPYLKLKMFGMCSGNNLPPYVEYIKNPCHETLIKLYQESDVFIFPSLEEGWGLTPIEAMACGCVVVGTNTGFVLDLGRHEDNMMISEPGDVDGMALNIQKLLCSSSLYEVIRKNSIETAKKVKWNDSCIILSDLLKG